MKLNGILDFFENFGTDCSGDSFAAEKPWECATAPWQSQRSRHSALANHGGFFRIVKNVAFEIKAELVPEISPVRSSGKALTVQFSVAGATSRRIAFPAVHVQFAPTTVHKSV